jgi:hypothetical protein
MQLNVDFSELQLAASKMNGLNGLLDELRKQKLSYQNGLSRAIEFVNHNGGKVIELPNNQTQLTLGNDEAICFQPYADIDLFYYEN